CARGAEQRPRRARALVRTRSAVLLEQLSRGARKSVNKREDGPLSFGAATPITQLNDAAANDIQPNVRKDGREIVNGAGAHSGSAPNPAALRRAPLLRSIMRDPYPCGGWRS